MFAFFCVGHIVLTTFGSFMSCHVVSPYLNLTDRTFNFFFVLV